LSGEVCCAWLLVVYSDVQPIWEMALQLLFWGTPIIYTIESVSNPTFQKLLMLSPLGMAIQQGRHWLVPDSTESAAAAIGGTWRLLIPIGIAVAVGVLSVWLFRR